MLKRLLPMVCLVLCTGVSCNVRIGDDDNGGISSPYVQLDDATLAMAIRAAATDVNAAITATVRRGTADVKLQDGQVVSVNGVALIAPNSAGEYRLSIPRQDSYVIRVEEPTLGVFETTVAAPGAFSITAPITGQSASLSTGFTLTWSNPDAALQYKVGLHQLLFGGDRDQILGPAADATGSLAISTADLNVFRQGSNLDVAVTKFREASVSGFATGSATVELSQTVVLVPAP